ncbi:hypothetical protein V1264_015252 [Littorina saxatilis]|uniref:Uncharacterized protein n=1 Tax=Littorina saxatilis TaxID=31220 RepID=A0AAN9BPM7_9CAEN
MQATRDVPLNLVAPSGQPLTSSVAVSGYNVHQEELTVDLAGSRQLSKICPSGSLHDYAMFRHPPITTNVTDDEGQRPCPTHQLRIRLVANDTGTTPNPQHPAPRIPNRTA